MPFPIYGIAGTQARDRVGERLHIKGADISKMSVFNDEHKSSNMFSILGQVDNSKKIFSEADCENDRHKKCWNLVKKPFIYVEGSLADDGHPNAAAAVSLIKYAQQNPRFKIGFSIEGNTLKKQDNDLIRTAIERVSLTVQPCNPECAVFPGIDLQKSLVQVELPDRYKGVVNQRSFKELPSLEARMLNKSMLLKDMIDLAKSGIDLDTATMMRCWNCGEARMLMKSRLPNRCLACSSPFSLADIFKAISQDEMV